LNGTSALASDTATPVSSDDFKGSGSALLAFTAHRAGSACMSFQGTTSDATQEISGSFKIVGGTQNGARLHAKGIFRAVERVPYTNRWMVAIYPTQVSMGSSRPLPRGCGQPKELNVTFAGFAFAPPSARNGALPAGTTIYPAGSTVSGSVGCGAANNLYAILTYSGPTGATVSVSYLSSSGKGGSNLAARQGKNNYPIVTAPPNGVYQAMIAISLLSYPTVEINKSLSLSRSC